MYVSEEMQFYRYVRQRFSLKAYAILGIFLIMALIQWLVVSLTDGLRQLFTDKIIICIATLTLGSVLFLAFIFLPSLRFTKVLNLIFAFIIAELQIISTFALIVMTWWFDTLFFFVLVLIMVCLAILIGTILPRRMDLTLDIAVLFILAFICVIVASFALVLQLVTQFKIPFAYMVVEIAVSFMVLVFIMFHAQTIYGHRYAEMRLYDFFLAALILFHDFLIIYWLTFYWQIQFRPITPDSWIENSSPLSVVDARQLDDDFYPDVFAEDTTIGPGGETEAFSVDPTTEYYKIIPKGKGKGPTTETEDFWIDPTTEYYKIIPKDKGKGKGKTTTKNPYRRPRPGKVLFKGEQPNDDRDDWDPEFLTSGAKEMPIYRRPKDEYLYFHRLFKNISHGVGSSFESADAKGGVVGGYFGNKPANSSLANGVPNYDPPIDPSTDYPDYGDINANDQEPVGSRAKEKVVAECRTKNPSDKGYVLPDSDNVEVFDEGPYNTEIPPSTGDKNAKKEMEGGYHGNPNDPPIHPSTGYPEYGDIISNDKVSEGTSAKEEVVTECPTKNSPNNDTNQGYILPQCDNIEVFDEGPFDNTEVPPTTGDKNNESNEQPTYPPEKEIDESHVRGP
ncbi:hypothetical protein KR009_009933 [Drosophila setifemur]|nr:hypothetical protein KR009_009933 [Drosophila setifemur]